MSVMRKLHKLLSVRIHHQGINKIYAANSIAFIITKYNHHQLCAVLAAKSEPRKQDGVGQLGETEAVQLN